MLGTIITSIVSFASTNIDDIFILMVLYAQSNDQMKKINIVIGQYIGIGILVALSILGAYGLHFFPQQYIGLLGLLPIVLGIKAWMDYKRENKSDLSRADVQSNRGKRTSEEEKNIDRPIQIDKTRADKKIHQMVINAKSILLKVVKPEIWSIMAVTIANGSDNIGIYTPIFSRYSIWELTVTVIVFAMLIGIWCLAGSKLANYPLIKTKIQKYKHILVPVVFIGLGIFIILESGVLGL